MLKRSVRRNPSMNMNKRALLLNINIAVLITAVCLMFASGCNEGKEAASKESGKMVAAVTIVPERAFAEAVCGDLAEVVVMVPPGYSPENYEPTPKQTEEFSKAAVYFAIGVPAEERILSGDGGIKGMKIVKLQDEVAKAYPDREIAPGERDPHIWLSPKRAKIMVEAIAREMGLIDGKNKERYMENAAKYIDELNKLDEEIKAALGGLKNRKFIVFHPAFGYFADDYGLEMHALEQEGKEATPRRLQEMVDFAKKEGIKAVFYQQEIDSKQSRAFAEEIGGRTILLDPLSPDYIGNIKRTAEALASVMH